MKTLVAFYSRSGNNRYLATRLARDLGADLRELVPRVRAFPVMVVFSLLGWSLGLKRASGVLRGYDRVVVCGPLWMGKLNLPALDFLRAAKRQGARVHLLACCGSTDAGKDAQFGYGLVLTDLRQRFPAVLDQAQALPVELVVPPDRRVDPQAMMAARLTDETFSGPIAQRYQTFVQSLA